MYCRGLLPLSMVSLYIILQYSFLQFLDQRVLLLAVLRPNRGHTFVAFHILYALYAGAKTNRVQEEPKMSTPVSFTITNCISFAVSKIRNTFTVNSGSCGLSRAELRHRHSGKCLGPSTAKGPTKDGYFEHTLANQSLMSFVSTKMPILH